MTQLSFFLIECPSSLSFFIGMCPWDGNIVLSWNEVKFKSHWWSPAAGVDYVASSWRGSSQIFFSFFLRMIVVSQGSVGSLCAAHWALSGSVWYVLFILMWIQAVTPATLTATGVVRTTVYGPFQCGAKESCFQSLTQIIRNTFVNLFP